MPDPRSRPILIAGAGIAGLTAAIAFGLRGYKVRLLEQAEELQAVGAGIQLSPNATHILAGLGVLDLLLPNAVQPPAVLLRDAASLRLLARVPLGEVVSDRGSAPYLTVHRADLQSALLQRAGQLAGVELITGARVVESIDRADSASVTVESGGKVGPAETWLLVGADGVWSRVQGGDRKAVPALFTGELAWRTTIESDTPTGGAFAALTSPDCVTTFLNPEFHLVAYPVRAGRAVNLVAFTKGRQFGVASSEQQDASQLHKVISRAAAPLREIVEMAGHWTIWPIHPVDQRQAWTSRNSVLIGDAAHAMTPFAAQGAAMAIEDGATLAAFVAQTSNHRLTDTLASWERFRRPRVERVTKRGALNKLAWNARGPVALARNLVLSLRPPEKLAADLDWLYGWRMPENLPNGA